MKTQKLTALISGLALMAVIGLPAYAGDSAYGRITEVRAPIWS